METEQQLLLSGRCCCLQRPLMSVWGCTDLSRLLLLVVPGDLSKCGPFPVHSAFLLSSPETCLVSALPSPAPGFALSFLELIHITCFSDALWQCDALQPFIYGKKRILNNLYLACRLSPCLQVLALRKHHVLGAQFLFPSGLSPYPLHPFTVQISLLMRLFRVAHS